MGLLRRLAAGLLLALFLLPARAEERFAAVDRHALAAAPGVAASVDSLAAYLAQGAATDTEKARVIFRWMAEHVDYDVAGYFGGTLTKVAADGILSQGRAGCDGYATLFEALATRLGLEVISIAGYAKGYGHKHATSFERPNHAWNAVKIDGRWLWVDPTWGAGFVRDGVYVRKLAEHFFLVEPDRWVLTHLPEAPPAHVALALPKAEFERLPNPDISLLGYRLPGAVLLATTRSEAFGGFVETFDQPPELVQLDAVPLHRRLPAGAPVSFRLASQAFEEIAAVADGQWLPFTHDGPRFALQLAPPKGSLQIAGRRAGEQSWLPFLSYEVE